MAITKRSTKGTDLTWAELDANWDTLVAADVAEASARASAISALSGVYLGLLATAAAATVLATPRAINGVAFDGSAAITITAAAGTLTGNTLASNVTASSLTSAAGGAFGSAAYAATSAFDAAGSAAAALASATAYTDAAVTGLLDFKGDVDASANPAYSAASKGDAYYVSVAGKIGGASGKSVEIGDVVVAKADNAGGTEASVGTSWFVMEHNLVGAAVTSGTLAQFAATTSAQLAGVISDDTGSGALVFANTPTLVSPILGTPTSGTLTNCSGLPVSGIASLGTGVATALGNAVNASGGFLTYGNAAVLGANTFTATQTHTIASANTGIIASTGYSLTGSNATSMIDLAGTWNTSGNPVALKIAITNTASGATSKFVSFLSGASGTTEAFSVDKAGVTTIGQAEATSAANPILSVFGTTAGQRPYFVLRETAADQELFIGCDTFGANGGAIGMVTNHPLQLRMNNTNTLILGSTTSVYVGSATVFGWASGAISSGGTVDAGVSRNAAGVIEANNGTAGTLRDFLARAYRHTATAFASLPTGVQGMVAHVSDSNTATWGATIAGGGANKVLAFYNGTNWTVAGV